jgi:hypothetical protein
VLPSLPGSAGVTLLRRPNGPFRYRLEAKRGPGCRKKADEADRRRGINQDFHGRPFAGDWTTGVSPTAAQRGRGEEGVMERWGQSQHRSSEYNSFARCSHLFTLLTR